MRELVRTTDAVLISAHGHVNRLILLHVMNRAPNDFWEIQQENGGLTRLEVESAP